MKANTFFQNEHQVQVKRWNNKVIKQRSRSEKEGHVEYILAFKQEYQEHSIVKRE